MLRPHCSGYMAQMYESGTRFHFCFVPLCKTGGGNRYFRCSHCGASYPT